MKKVTIPIISIFFIIFLSSWKYNQKDYWLIFEKFEAKYKIKAKKNDFRITMKVEFEEELQKLNGKEIELSGYFLREYLLFSKNLAFGKSGNYYAYCGSNWDCPPDYFSWEIIELRMKEKLNSMPEKKVTIKGTLKLNSKNPRHLFFILRNVICLNCELNDN